MSSPRVRKSHPRSNAGRDQRHGKSLMARDDDLDVNDILNFSLPPRLATQHGAPPRRGRKAGSYQPTWNKEKFVNAQYRFVMKPTGDYVVHFADPDIYFQWSDIEQILIPRRSASAALGIAETEIDQNTGSSCPICLSPPVAPRMTKCGHIFCLPCFIHYMATSQTRWHRCPICFDSITESQLKNVKWFDNQSLPVIPQDDDQAGSSSHRKSLLTFRLLERPQITTLALPKSVSWPSPAVPPLQAPFHFAPDVFDYARFMLATPEYLREALGADMIRLAAELDSCRKGGDDGGATFAEIAIDKVKQQIEDIKLLETPTIKNEIERTRSSLQVADRHQTTRNSAPPRFNATSEDGPEQYLSTLNAPSYIRAQPRKNQRRNVNPPPPSNSSYFFYQAAGGLPIFLHPLDIRILLSKFSTYSSFPHEITVPIDAFEEGTVNDDLRKRCKYLAHLPESTDVVFIEANLEPVVGTDGIKPFEAALRSRRAKRNERNRRDERNRIRAEEKDRERERKEGLWRDADFIAPSPVVIEERGDSGTTDSPPDEHSPTPTITGAWGQRSFAAAAHASAAAASHANVAADLRNSEDDLQLEQAWNELERRQAGGGRKKGRVKLVVLGGAGGRRR